MNLFDWFDQAPAWIVLGTMAGIYALGMLVIQWGAHMPRAAMRPCARQGCPHLVQSGERFCAEHAKERRGEWDRDRPSPSARGYDEHWRKLRRVVLGREPLCRACSRAGLVVAAAEVDHIQPLAKGGTNDLDNLQPLCKSCHSKKTMRESVNGNGWRASGAEPVKALEGRGGQILGTARSIPSPAASRTPPRLGTLGVHNADETDADGD